MNRWQLVQELFESTLDLSPSERKQILTDRAKGCEEVINEVEALIAADTSPFDDFDRGAGELLDELREEADPNQLCGQSFGHYEIEQHLSTGGMAHVYRAKRSTTDTERRVALKVMRPGIDTDLCRHRFGQERRLLADLEHENIVSFLDAGELADGRPFLAMEFIDGVAITDWAKNKPQRRILEVFLRVLATVQYAHQRLVIHRDLKPSNVMISSQGTPKLLDFGVASIVESDVETQATHEPLTPAYASPEQLRGESVSTASDVFSLGMLLHEVLCDSLPEIPSETSNSKLDSSLRSILGKALAMDSRERYGSADQFAEDLKRYLLREPHSASPQTWTHRAGLFVQRNLWPLALAASLLITLGLGWINADLDRRLAEQEANLGWVAHAQAKTVAQIFERWIALEERGTNEDTVAYLENALSEGMTDLPEAETLLRMTLAQIQLDRGRPDLAKDHAERAFSLSRHVRGMGRGDRERAAKLLDEVRAEIPNQTQLD